MPQDAAGVAYWTALVSMKSGLEGRNNQPRRPGWLAVVCVSMKSGLEGRNNSPPLQE